MRRIDGRETFAYEALVDPLDHFSPFDITPDHVAGSPTFGHVHAIVAGHLTGMCGAA